METPSNPLTEIADIKAISKIAKKAKALFAVDNCFCTPALQKPLALGADGIALSNSAIQAIGCVGARMCNTNDCPAGIATQKPELISMDRS